MSPTRLFIAFLLSITVPWAATASALAAASMQSHAGVPSDRHTTAVAVHAADQAMSDSMDMSAMDMDGMDMSTMADGSSHCRTDPAAPAKPMCDCAAKSCCGHHCGSSTPAGFGYALPASSRFDRVSQPALMERRSAPGSRLINEVFRPPSAALQPSAA